jgi:hypothetical protein
MTALKHRAGITPDNVLRKDLKADQGQIDKENDAENQVIMCAHGDEFVTWPKYCYQETIFPPFIDCINCHNHGKIQCSPRWRDRKGKAK